MMKSLRDIEDAIKDITVTTDKDTDERILSDALAALEDAAATSSSPFDRIRYGIFSAAPFRVAAAAGLVAVVLVGMYFWQRSPVPPETPRQDIARISTDHQTPSLGSRKLVPLETDLPGKIFEENPGSLVADNLEPYTEKRPPFYVPQGVRNVALHKPVSSSDTRPLVGSLELITDGDKSGMDGSYVELAPHRQHITIDLEDRYDIYAVLLWHYHKQARIYNDVIVQVSDSADFGADVITVFNNDDDNSSGLGYGRDRKYVESHLGKLIDARGVPGRFVRLYSNGNNVDEMNHYVEVEVFALPSETPRLPVAPQGTPRPLRPDFMGTPRG